MMAIRYSPQGNSPSTSITCIWKLRDGCMIALSSLKNVSEGQSSHAPQKIINFAIMKLYKLEEWSDISNARAKRGPDAHILVPQRAGQLPCL